MYIRDFEIDHLREKHPSLLDQLSGYGLEKVSGGYRTAPEIPNNLFTAVIIALEAVSDAPDTRKGAT